MRSSSTINKTKTKQRAPPRKKACQNCTISKVRCALEKPVCSRCRAQGRPCQYPSGRIDDLLQPQTRRDIGATEDHGLTFSEIQTPPSDPGPEFPIILPGSESSYQYSTPPRERRRTVDRREIATDDGIDFTHIDLVSNKNAVDIRDRWLRPYLLPPLGRDEIPKIYPPFTLQYISMVLRTYPQRMLKDNGIPPIIHSLQVYQNQMPRALANCSTLVRMWEQAVPGSEMMVVNTVENEMERLANETPDQHDYDLLSSFQVYLIYSILMYLSPLNDASPFTDKTMITLMELAFRTARNGLFCTAETAHARPTWESWIVASAKRRAIFAMYLLSSVYNADRCLPNFLADEMKGVYVPESRALWEAKDRESWTREYDRHLLEWEDGMLEISELWRSAETGSVERRRRIERWVKGVDEFGMMLFAVCAHIHGC